MEASVHSARSTQSSQDTPIRMTTMILGIVLAVAAIGYWAVSYGLKGEVRYCPSKFSAAEQSILGDVHECYWYNGGAMRDNCERYAGCAPCPEHGECSDQGKLVSCKEGLVPRSGQCVPNILLDSAAFETLLVSLNFN